MPLFILEAGTSTDSCLAALALRRRGQHVGDRICNMHILSSLPACFFHAGNLSLVSKLTEADAANAIVTKVGMRSSAELAAVIPAGGELRRSLLL